MRCDNSGDFVDDRPPDDDGAGDCEDSPPADDGTAQKRLADHGAGGQSTVHKEWGE